jgi:hypothetical protein
MLSYFYTVYVPKFQKEYNSFSLYSKPYEKKLQLFFWGLVLASMLSVGYHCAVLHYCSSHYLATICYLIQYSWSLSALLLAASCIVAMILHYGNEDVNRESADYQTASYYDIKAKDYVESDPDDSLD